MANIKKIVNKDGLSFKITVCSGRDTTGKQMRHYRTFVPPKTWSEQRASKEAVKQAALFEESIEDGYILDNRQTFAEYAEYVLGLKLRQGNMKESTHELYNLLLTRINPAIGHLKLAEIRPAHLNNLYDTLSKEGGRAQAVKATPKVDISELIKSKKLTREKVSELCEISHNTVTMVCRGRTIHAKIAEKIAKVLGADVNTLFNVERNTTPLSAKTVLEHHRLISSILAQAEKEMLIPYNSASKAAPPHPKKPEPNYFQPETIHQILEAVDTEPLKYRVFINLLIVTGCRRGEVAGLKWNKIDFNTGKIIIDCGLYYSVKRGVYEGTTKTNERRSMKIPMEVVPLLRQLRREQAADRISNGDRWTETGYVFTQDNGLPMNPDSFNTLMIRFSKSHGLPHINPHAFRHTMASVLISNGVDVVTTSKMLGHASVTTTESFYAHVIEDAKDAATETISAVLLKRKA